MTARRLGTAFSVLLGLGLAGCSPTIGLYHDIEGGAIAQNRQPPPGANLPYPNLADVPPAQPALTPAQAAAISAQSHNAGTGVSRPSPGALAGLELPTAPPPPPGVEVPTPGPLPVAAPAPKPVPVVEPAPVALAFPPASAVLPFADAATLQKLSTAKGTPLYQVGGFGDGDLPLALARAQRLADALTADGVSPSAIRITAMAAGSGGFVQLVY